MFSEVVVSSYLNKNFGGSTDLAKKRHGSADLHTPIHPVTGDDQLFEYDDDSDNDSDGFVVQEDGAILDMRSEDLGYVSS